MNQVQRPAHLRLSHWAPCRCRSSVRSPWLTTAWCYPSAVPGCAPCSLGSPWRPAGPVPLSELIDSIWGDQPPADATNALQTLVSRLRRAAVDPGVVVQEPGGYRLAVAEADVDAFRFSEL